GSAAVSTGDNQQSGDPKPPETSGGPPVWANSPTYDYRANAFVGRRLYRLTPEAMTWEEAGKPLDGVFFDDISEIRLAYAPTRWATNRFRAQIIFRQGGMAELSNTDYVSIGNFKELNADYRAFLSELHRRLADHHTPTAYRVGNSPGGYIANWLLMIFV